MSPANTIERLESRTMLAATIGPAPAKVLLITGTSKNDRINIETQPAGLRVSINGSDQTFGYDDFGRIHLDTFRGSDQVDVRIDPALKSTDILVSLAAGNDRFVVDGSVATTIRGGEGDDTIVCGADRDTVFGEDGNDFINGGAKTDCLFGGNGDDTVLGGPGVGKDTVDGGAGSDFLRGGDGEDFLGVGLGDDADSGAGLYNTLGIGGNGFGLIYGDPQSGDTAARIVRVRGVTHAEFSGNDLLLDFSAAPNAIQLTKRGDAGGANTTVLGSAFDDRFFSVAGLVNAGDGDDTFFFSGGGTLYGEGGNDVVAGGHGDDSIFGGDGNDVLNGNGGDDQIFGDAGNDSIVGKTGNDLIDAGSGDDLVNGDDGGGEFTGESGPEGNDTIFGGLGRDTLFGNGGNDRLEGAGGNDSLNGGAGADRLYGQNGNDTLNGAGGNDLLFGGPTSADRIIGGAGINDRAADDEKDSYLDVEALLA